MRGGLVVVLLLLAAGAGEGAHCLGKRFGTSNAKWGIFTVVVGGFYGSFPSLHCMSRSLHPQLTRSPAEFQPFPKHATFCGMQCTLASSSCWHVPYPELSILTCRQHPPPNLKLPPPAGLQGHHDLGDIGRCGGRLPHERHHRASGCQRQRRSTRVHSHAALLGVGRRPGAALNQEAETAGSAASLGVVLGAPFKSLRDGWSIRAIVVGIIRPAGRLPTA